MQEVRVSEPIRPRRAAKESLAPVGERPVPGAPGRARPLWRRAFRWADVAYQTLVGVFFATHAYMVLFVTARCNARCSFCFYWEEIESAHQRHELSLEEIERISRNLKRLLYLSIGGGEPTLRRDLPDIVSAFYRNAGTRFVNITTNGLKPALIENQVERILTENPHLFLRVAISLDGLEKTHDELRKVPGIFRKVRETHDRLVALRRRGYSFGLNVVTTYSKLNQAEILQLIDFVDRELDVTDHSMTFARGNTKDPEAIDASVEGYKQAVDYLYSKHTPSNFVFRVLHNVLRVMFKINIDTMEQNRMIVPCVAGGKMITLDDQGVLKPCELLAQRFETDRFDIGNVREAGYDVRGMMQSPKARDVRKWIRDTECHCTFECANMANVVFDRRTWPKVLRGYIQRA